MTEQEIQMFKDFFRKYCYRELGRGRCNDDLCEFCPIDTAYEEIFDRLSDVDDD